MLPWLDWTRFLGGSGTADRLRPEWVSPDQLESSKIERGGASCAEDIDQPDSSEPLLAAHTSGETEVTLPEHLAELYERSCETLSAEASTERRSHLGARHLTRALRAP